MANKPCIEEIDQKIQIAIENLFEKDSFLLLHKVHERSISHKLGEYLQMVFLDWNVDCEYNKKGDATKKMISIPQCRRNRDAQSIENEQSVYPDIIIHQRNKKENLLVIEIKTNKLYQAWDIEKLKYFTSPIFEYKYSFGLFIRFNRLTNPEKIWVENGEITGNLL